VNNATLLGVVVITVSAATARAEELKLLISLDRATVTAPYPVRVTLHLHNAGSQSSWFYRPVGNPSEGGAEAPLAQAAGEFGPNPTSGGSTLEILLKPSEGSATGISSPARGKVFESAGLPHPALSRLAPQEDTEERVTLLPNPALYEAAGKAQPVWGSYKLAVVYRSKYSNWEDLERILGIHLWQGELRSNTVDIDLESAPVSEQGSIEGSVVGPDLRPVPAALVSLNDHEEARVSQILTDEQGRFSFDHLPLGLFWVTGRRTDSNEDTDVFRHVDLTPANPTGTTQLVLLSPDIHEAKRLAHKPVLFRVEDNQNRPLSDVRLSVTWSSGTVLDEIKGRTSEEGTVALELIPGRNYLTLRRKGCKKEDQRVDVAPGAGIDGFKLTLDCSQK
jgi:hypothetical protein